MKTLSTTSLKKLLNLIKTNFFQKSEAQELTVINIDTTPTSGSQNLITSGGTKTALDQKENLSNKVSTLSSSSTNTQYPGAKVVYDQLATKSTVSVATTGTSTTEGNYITVNGTQYKIKPDEFTAAEVDTLWDSTQ